LTASVYLLDEIALKLRSLYKNTVYDKDWSTVSRAVHPFSWGCMMVGVALEFLEVERRFSDKPTCPEAGHNEA